MKSAARPLVSTRAVTLRSLIDSGPLHAYTESAASDKNLFHLLAVKWLRAVATQIGEDPKEVTSNRAGIAVSGEISLNGRNVYVRLAAYGTPHECGLVRAGGAQGRYHCERKNHVLPAECLNDVGKAVAWIQGVIGEEMFL